MTERYARLAPHRARDAVAKRQSRSHHVKEPVDNIEVLLARKKKA